MEFARGGESVLRRIVFGVTFRRTCCKRGAAVVLPMLDKLCGGGETRRAFPGLLRDELA